jgi:ABC-type multidrug transport system fused ATPase/permease subunit
MFFRKFSFYLRNRNNICGKMNMLVLFVTVAIFSSAVFFFFNYIDQPSLGIILVVIMFCWPIIFWFISKLTENYGKINEEEVRKEKASVETNNNENIEEETNAPREIVKEPEKKIEETANPKPKKLSAEMKEDIEALKKVAVLLEQERKEGILSEETYNELKKQNDDEINKLRAEIKIDEEISKS